MHQPFVETPPLLNGLLVGPDGPCQRVIAGCEACAHAGGRASRAGGLGELPDIEGFRKQFSLPLGLPFDDGLDDFDVAQIDEAYACLFLERAGRARRARPFGTGTADGRRSAKVIKSRLGAALAFVQLGEIVEAHGDIGMFRPENLLQDCQRPPEERLRRLVAALGTVQPGEVVEARGHRGMVRPEHLLPDCQRPLSVRGPCH